MRLFKQIKAATSDMSRLLEVISEKWNMPFNTRNQVELVNHYRGWVYACVAKKSHSVAGVPLRLYKNVPEKSPSKHFVKKGNGLTKVNTTTYESWLANKNIASHITKGLEIEEITEDHPLLDLLRQVNPFANKDDLMYSTEAYLQMIGNSYWYLIPSKMPSLAIQGRYLPKEIWPILSQYMHPVPDANKFISGYKIEIQGKKKTYSPSEIIHFKHFNPKSMIEGMGPLEAAAYAVDIDEQKKKYTFSFFKNSAIPPYFFKMPFDAEKQKGPIWTPKQWRKFKHEFLESHGGPDKAGSLALLQGGLDITQIGVSPKDFTYLLMTKPAIEEIAAIFGIPLFKLTGEGVDRLNAEKSDYSYQRDTIRPELATIEQKLNEQLTPLYDPNIFLVYDNNIPDDKVFELEEQTKLVDTVLTKNEVRTVRGLLPIEGGDSIYIPANMIPVGSPPPEDGKSIDFDKLAADVKHKLLHHCKEQITPEMQVIADKLAPVLAPVFNGYHNEVLSKMNQYPNGPITSWINGDEFSKELYDKSDVLRTEFSSAGQEGIDQITKSAKYQHKYEEGVEVVFNIESTLAAEQMLKLQEGFSVYPIATTQADLNAALAEGMRLGESIAQLKIRVSKIFGVMGADQGIISADAVTRRNWRILRVARTEAARAYNYGHMEGWRQTGLVKAKAWQTGVNPCELCESLQGATMPLDDSFDAKIADFSPSFDFGYGEAYAPPLHPNCGCYLIPITL